MRVGIDARTTQGRFTGDTTYWRGLIQGLSRLGSDDEFILYLDSKLPEPEIPPGWSFKIRPLSSLNRRTWSVFAFPRALREDRVDVAHVQYTIPPHVPCPVITSIHDVSFKRLPEFFKWKDRAILDWGAKRAAKQASRILALSEYTKKELLELYKVPPEKISLVYPGFDEQFKPLDREACQRDLLAKYGIASPFILTVGVIQPRKNLARLLAGYAKLKTKNQTLPKLVIVGKYGWKEAHLPRRIEELGITENVVLTGHVPYEDLPVFYSAAEVSVYPSVYEGFGLPPLEAMACGTPVITGDRSSLPEVVGDAGIMVDPYSPEAFMEALVKVLARDSPRAEMRSKGLERASHFSWVKTASQVLEIYHEVVGGRS